MSANINQTNNFIYIYIYADLYVDSFFSELRPAPEGAFGGRAVPNYAIYVLIDCVYQVSTSSKYIYIYIYLCMYIYIYIHVKEALHKTVYIYIYIYIHYIYIYIIS